MTIAIQSLKYLAMAKEKAKSKKNKAGADGHLNFSKGSYLESTSRPLYALFFLLPLILIYEVCTFAISADRIASHQARVAAFTWIAGLAEWIGMHQALAWAFPGLAVVIILLCWQMASENSWKVNIGWIGWMAVEALVLTAPLFVMGILLNSSNGFAAAGNSLQTAPPSNIYYANLITSIGAGIYEELVFRLILLGLILVLLEDLLKIRTAFAVGAATSLSALLFALHHYYGFDAAGRFIRLEDFNVGSFIFRALAGVYFAVLFHFRGYGVVAGTHGFYNIIYFSITG